MPTLPAHQASAAGGKTAETPDLRLGHPLLTLRATLHNGPGWRVPLWVQGCSLLCTKDCLNPHYLPGEGGFSFPVATVLAAVLAAAGQAPGPCEGITVLGGEPTDQIEAVTALLAGTRRAGLGTMLYTGYPLEALRRRDAARVDALLQQTDLLKDGPFQEARYENDLPWRGSSNQRLHCLSDRYTPEGLAEAYARQGKGYSILIDPDGTISLSGLQDRAGAAAAEKILREFSEGPVRILRTKA